MSATVSPLMPAGWCPKCRACTCLNGRCVVCEYDAVEKLRETQSQVRTRRRRFRVRRFIVDHYTALCVVSILVSGLVWLGVSWWARS